LRYFEKASIKVRKIIGQISLADQRALIDFVSEVRGGSRK
jgi:hypothetical protein